LILDDVAKIMSSESARRISRKTGLSKNKIYRMSNGIPFLLDYETISALHSMGYEICLQKLSHERDS